MADDDPSLTEWLTSEPPYDDLPRWFFSWALILVVALIGVVYFATFVHQPVDESTYTGHVLDLEYEKGLVYQTTTVHMKTHPRSSSSESFCLLDAPSNPLTPRLQEAAQNQSRWTVTYDAPLFKPPWDCSTMPILRSGRLVQGDV